MTEATIETQTETVTLDQLDLGLPRTKKEYLKNQLTAIKKDCEKKELKDPMTKIRILFEGMPELKKAMEDVTKIKFGKENSVQIDPQRQGGKVLDLTSLG